MPTGTFPDLQLMIGIYPIAPLVMAVITILLYRLLLFQRVVPRHGITFLVSGAVLTFVSFFCAVVRRTPFKIWELNDKHEIVNEFERAYTIIIRERRFAALNDKYQELSEWMGFQPIFLFIGVTMLLIFVVQLARLRRIQQKALLTREEEGIHIYRTNLATPFSFSNSIFLPRQLSDKHMPYVLAHEMSHVRNRHFSVLFWLRLLLCTQWYNPFFWLILYEIRLLQEFQADTDALSSDVDRQSYQFCLLEMATQRTDLFTVANHFAKSSLKQRIQFMNKSIASRTSRRRTIYVTLILGLAGISTLSCQPDINTAPPTDNSQPAHPLYGTWIRRAMYRGSDKENKDFVGGCYKIIGNDIAFLVELTSGDMINNSNYFYARTIDFTYICDTLVQEDGLQFPIKFITKDMYSFVWGRRSFSPPSSTIKEELVTEIWERSELPPALKKIFDIKTNK